MAHEFETGFFVSEPAWHGLGVVLQDPPTVAEALAHAGLDWKVQLAPLHIGNVAGAESPLGAQFDEPTMYDGREVSSRVVLRNTDRSILGIVGPDYEPLQNADALAWFQPFVDSGSVRLEAAGSLKEGRRVWVLGRVIGAGGNVIKSDRVDQFILLANGHDGTMSVRLGLTAVRVVCQNTLTAAVGNSNLLAIRHTKGAKLTLDAAQEYIAKARERFADTMGQLQFLGQAKCSDGQLVDYVREVFELVAPAEGEEDSSRITARIQELFQSGRGADLPGVRGTMWGAFNAVTEFLTHERGKSADNRVDSVWFGPGAQLTQRALATAVRFAHSST
jgi:phage/plasmid-like protein (TIGR03299 family)